MTTDKYFNLRTPCKQCPFRTDFKPFLRPARAVEICGSLYNGASFPCHKTTATDDDGEYCRSESEMHCAGALIMLEHIERPNQIMRTMERLGGYDREKLDMSAPVYKSPAAMIAAYKKGKS